MDVEVHVAYGVEMICAELARETPIVAEDGELHRGDDVGTGQIAHATSMIVSSYAHGTQSGTRTAVRYPSDSAGHR